MARIHPAGGGAGVREESGCLPCGNCLVVVPQDRFFALETFGKFSQILEPGLRWAGFDVGGACVGFRSISSRVVQSHVRVPTKTADNVFVDVDVAVQHTVSAATAEDALYKLDNISEQLESYVAGDVRSFVPTLTLDECFEKKDEISSTIESTLRDAMIQYGHEIRKALVVNVEPDSSVKQSMNEINKQKRLRDASQMQAEAAQVRVRKAAEASADAAQLQGEGIARQRRAIIDGIRESVTFGTEEELSADHISHLLVVTQYYETMRDVAASNQFSIVFLDGSVGAVKDLVGQVRKGMPRGGTSKPKQQDMVLDGLASLTDGM
ncbi:unnamed protein product [Effrenium voratum]|nr:unnamed protein product [Effrenium voratum]CAJ1452052.1 unnamed protein product [Effrenium voratum]